MEERARKVLILANDPHAPPLCLALIRPKCDSHHHRLCSARRGHTTTAIFPVLEFLTS